MPLSGTELILVLVCFLVAIWNTSVGPTGAITFATMATLLPPAAVIPLHAIVEAGANLSRAWLLRQFVDWQFALPFIGGGLIGIVVAAPILSQAFISQEILQVFLGINLLLITWMTLPSYGLSKRLFSVIVGLITSFLTLFVGATSPLVSTLISQRDQDHRRMLGTSAACMLFQHGVKIPIFGLLGFSITAHAKLVLFLLLAIILGTWLGRKVLLNLPQNVIKPIFKVLITVLGINLIRQGLT